MVYLTHPAIACWRLNDEQSRRLSELLPGACVVNCAAEKDFLRELSAAEIAVVWDFKQEWLERAPLLRVVATPSAGKDYFKIDTEKVRVIYGGFHGAIIAETVAGMILALNRGLLAATRSSSDWPRAQIASAMRTVRASRAVILGYGKIGKAIGEKLEALGIKVEGITSATLPALDALLPAADHLILALPATSSTDNILDSRRLALLPPHAAVYNIGRGNAIDEEALCAALREGRLAAACLDVRKNEPSFAEDFSAPPPKAPNLYLFPHSAAIAPEYLDRFIEELAPRLAADFC